MDKVMEESRIRRQYEDLCKKLEALNWKPESYSVMFGKAKIRKPSPNLCSFTTDNDDDDVQLLEKWLLKHQKLYVSVTAKNEV